ncbi:MAG TPA: MBOAT family protein [Sedimentisphaerales bacterium]|nr:MBOAT family protein [Sedimentisphaerales bacterium]HRS10419.1 MBOAT family protein [Sedimentisphaerales bacterium]HRV47124.1 MBOAT family protein [Sedimentisphaerales bacterium]
MAFTSHIFLFYFLPVVLALYHVLPARWLAARNVLLLVAGYVFYGWIDLRLTALLFGMSVANYVLSRVIAGRRTRGVRLAVTAGAIAFDLVVLGIFKYTAFLGESLNSLLRLVGRDTLPVLRIALPAGISFYTFKIISYIADVYRGRSPAARSLLDFACYVSFFPQLLSGPIQRFGTIDAKGEIVPTFADQFAAREHTLDKFAHGVALFMLGFAKKILLADGVAPVGDAVFAAASPGTLDVWFGALAYSFQLYFDFSAYSEMAIGLGLMFGFECARNFDTPYRADSFGDFWRRWHISLSGWLRDYLYIPLGGNRAGTGRTYINLMIVFLLCGLWHGAGWTFLVWGAWHGLWLVVERLLGRKPFYAFLPAPIRVLVTFLLMIVGWVIFRAPDLAEAGRMLAIMFVPQSAQGGSALLSAVLYTRGHLMLMALCALLAFQPVQGYDWTRQVGWIKILVLVVVFALALMTMFAQSFRSFLYFQF